MTEQPIDLTEDVSRDLAQVRPAHPWFAVRPPTLGRAAVFLTLLRSPERFSDVYGAPFDRRALAREAGLDENSRVKVLDVFAGTSSIAGEAALLGFAADAVELNPVAHFIAYCTWTLPRTYGRPNEVLGWRGLRTELAEAAEGVWRAASEQVASLFPSPHTIPVWVEVGSCPRCEAAVTLGNAGIVAPQLAAHAADPGGRGRVACHRCGHVSTAAAIRDGGIYLQLTAVADGAALITGDALGRIEDAAASATTIVARFGRDLRAPEPAAIDPQFGVARQAAVVLALAAEVVALQRRWRDAKRDATRSQALVDCLALCVSATSRLARRDGRLREGGRFITSSRLGEHRRMSFAEPSLDAWRREWERRVRLLLDQIDRAASAPGSVDVHLADAAALPFASESFDAVICDPPYFDNVQYGDESRPHYGWLRLMVGDSHPDLFGGEAPSDEAQVVVRRAPADRHAELERYGALLTATVNEAARVLAPDRCLSFVFTARDAAQLVEFLRQVQPQGLELVDAIRVAQERHAAARADDESGSYILLFRKSRAVAAVAEPSVDADVVLDLATLGRSKLYAAIAEILEVEWDDETAAATIPLGYEGTRSQQIQELVAAHADPASLLAELGAPTLRRHAERRGVPEAQRRAGATGLAEAILRAVGFSVPASPRFTFTGQRSEAMRCAAELHLASTIDELRGRFLTGSSAVERAVRYGTVAWVQAISGGEWLETLKRLFIAVSDKRFAGPGSLTFGQWQAIFFVLPRLQEEIVGPLHGRLAGLKRALGRKGAQADLERLVKVRNLVEHPPDELLAGPLDELRELAADGIAAGVKAMETLMATGSWPQVLQPLDERRDRYDRLTLRTLDEQHATVELFVDHPVDLTRPYLWFPGGSNPREVEPLLVPLEGVSAGTDLRV